MKRFATIMAMGTTAATGSPLLNSLISYWTLDEASGTRVDSHGSNDLSDNNTVGSTTGIISNGANFVATNTEFLSHASNASLQMSGNTDFTISLWVKFSSIPSFNADYQLVTKDDDAANSRDYNFDYAAAVSEGFRFYTLGGAVRAKGLFDWSSPPTVGNWYFLVGWYDSSNGQLHYRVNDSTQADSGTGLTGTDVSAAEFRIGAREYAGFEGYADAVIDEVGIWKRLLTSQEITDLYNGGSGLTYPF